MSENREPRDFLREVFWNNFPSQLSGFFLTLISWVWIELSIHLGVIMGIKKMIRVIAVWLKTIHSISSSILSGLK